MDQAVRRVLPVRSASQTPIPGVPKHLQRYVMDYQATDHGTWQIYQGHADVCAILGHATNTVNGVLQAYCPRCGEPRNA